ncbi:porin [Derxia gummosa]|uniref:Porin n=1 Tax=Derxia gummosa DSM 723 TaxID=1121388 RepID=A0A8B6X6U3_9BURK|nr:porin [Derxia gummosa]
MKLQTIGACAIAVGIAAAFQPAVAQTAPAGSSVTVYGIMDAGVEYRTRNAADGKGMWRVNSGGLNTSRLGLRGSEDLGDGMKAVFNLEGEVNLDSGASGSALWGRYAYVGLEKKNLGTVMLGRNSTTVYDFVLPHDFMGYAPQYSYLTSTATVPATGFTSRVSNAVKYVGKFDAVTLGAHYGFGEVAGATGSNNAYGFGAAYAKGPVSAQLSFDEGRSGGTEAVPASTRNRSVVGSGSYDLGPAKLYAGLRATTRAPAAPSAANPHYRSDLWWLGASAPLSQAVTLYGGAYYENKRDTDSSPLMFAAKITYNLSKRTWLYAVAASAHSSSDDGAHVKTGVFRDQTPLASQQSGFGVGVQHRF